TPVGDATFGGHVSRGARASTRRRPSSGLALFAARGVENRSPRRREEVRATRRLIDHSVVSARSDGYSTRCAQPVSGGRAPMNRPSGEPAFRSVRQNPWWIPRFLGGVPVGVEPAHLRVLGFVTLAMFFENYDLGMFGNAL